MHFKQLNVLTVLVRELLNLIPFPRLIDENYLLIKERNKE